MEHDPEVMRICALAFLEEAKEHQEKLQWSKENLQMAQEGMDSIKAPSLGSEPAIRSMSDKIALAYDKLQNAREEFAAQMAESTGFLSEARKICNSEDSATWICWLHYVDGWTWEEVRDGIGGYSVSHLKSYLVHKGFERIYKKMPEEYRRRYVPNAQVGLGFGACFRQNEDSIPNQTN